MNTYSPAKLQMIRDQVFAKIHWGARNQEVEDWLRVNHQIAGEQAAEMLAAAHRAKRSAVRKKAIMMIVISSIGVIGVAWIIVAQFMSGYFVTEKGILGVYGVGLVSIGVFFRSLFQLITGHLDGSVD